MELRRLQLSSSVVTIFVNLTAIAVGFATPFAVIGIWQYCRKKLTGRGRGGGIVGNDTATGTNTTTGTLIVPTKLKDYERWNTAIFFPCPPGLDNPETSMNQLLSYLKSAEVSIKVCIMTLTYRPAYDVLIQKHNEGVPVFIFTSYFTASRHAKKLRNKGIPVRSRPKAAYSTEMHNKYVIIDDDAVLTGSLNWTIESIHQQRENILITTDYRIVPKYVKHFDHMWNNFWDEEVDPEGNRLDED